MARFQNDRRKRLTRDGQEDRKHIGKKRSAD